MLNDTKPAPLTIERVIEQWSKTYNTDGKPDWSHIFPYYDENIIFHDSIQRIEGKEAFIELCNRLTKRCEQLSMHIQSIAQNSNIILFDWKMMMAFRRFPNTPVFGSTKLTLNENGLIIEQRDYYDLWGDIFNGIPGFRSLYRSFLKRYFG